MSDHGGKSSRWEAQRIISNRNGNISGYVKCTKQRNWATRKYLPFILPFFAVKIHQKEKAGKQKKKRVKQRGSQTIFYSMTFLNKNIVHRSKVYLCTAVVWEKKRHLLKTGRYILSITTRASSLYCGYFKGLVCKVFSAGAIPVMLPSIQKHLPNIKDQLVIPSFIKWSTSSCKVAGCQKTIISIYQVNV